MNTPSRSAAKYCPLQVDGLTLGLPSFATFTRSGLISVVSIFCLPILKLAQRSLSVDCYGFSLLEMGNFFCAAFTWGSHPEQVVGYAVRFLTVVYTIQFLLS